jgi:hypothetical protein
MTAARRAGRIIGVLMLAQMAAGMFINLVLLVPVFRTPGFLENAAADALRVRLAVLLGIAASASSVAIAIEAMPAFRRHSVALAAWLLALAVAAFSLSAVENQALMSALSLSQAYVAAGGAAGETFDALRGVVAAARNWGHFIGLMVSGTMLLVFYYGLLRCALVPRALAALGLAAVLVMLTAVTMPLFGRHVVFLMLMPLALAQLVTALWLIARGFAERPAAPATT